MKERTKAFLLLLIFIALLCALLALPHEADWMLGKLFILAATVVVIFKTIFGKQVSSVPTWIDAMSIKWQRRVLGESDEAQRNERDPPASR